MATGETDTDALSDQTFDFLCNVCKRKGKTSEAKKYCADCRDYYCMTCVKVHDDLPLLTGHKIVDKAMIQKGSAKTFPVALAERCEKHDLKPVDMYCQNHDQVGCSTCMAAGHRLCKDIFYIPDYVQNMTSTCNPQNIKQILASTEETLKVTVQLCEQEKQYLLKRKAESKQNVRQVRKEFDQMLDELEQASLAEIENKYEEMISKLEERITTFRDAKRNVVSAKDNLAAAGNNTSQIFVSTKTGQSFATEAEIILNKRKITCYYEYITITGDPKLKEMLKKLKSLGQVTSRYVLKGMKKYPIENQSFSGDRFSSIGSLCVLEDGTIVLAFTSFQNWILIRLERSTYRVRDNYKLPSCPFQVCAIDNHEVGVSYRMQEIMLISLGKQMTKKSVIETDFDCHAVAYANDNLYISDQCTSVYIYSVSGQKLKQFRVTGLLQSWTSDSFDIRIMGLCVNKDGSRIYVANAKKGLTVLDNNGKVVRKFNEQAECLHLTRTGTVLMCDYSYILKLTPVGKQIDEVLNDVHGCQTVSCNQQMSKMIVSSFFRNEIKVYDLV